ncbi:MAG: two-component system, chemotaxis family, sensor kinase CheA [Alphaproteobacteria bacterium]|nr:two-component system, chemotaxis family, sensor kinase CheA [Alphaproteobacteria bacterium]
MPPDVLAGIKLGFFEECEELLSELEAGLLALKRGETDPEIINKVFRAAHSIKGGGASFGLAPMVDFAHQMESVLAAIRSNQLALDAQLLGLLLRAADVLADHVRAARDEGRVESASAREIEGALIALVAGDCPAGEVSNHEPAEGKPTAAVWSDSETPSPATAQERIWVIRFRPHASLYASANEPLFLLRELQYLGEVRATVDDSELPSIDDLVPEDAYLLWAISLTSTADAQEIRRVFEFVEADCDLEIVTDQEGAATPVADRNHPTAGSAAVSKQPDSPRPSISSSGIAAGRSTPRLSETIRVDVERVDRLINLASELVINHTILAQRLAGIGSAGTSETELPLDELHQLTRELQNGVMAIRAQPLKVVFQRLSRLVREVEAVTGKQVNLVVEGESTEVDRTVIERLIDPMTHMVRNAIDHGIETPEERLASGKTAQGTLRISATHRAGRIIIEITDDGCGINRARVHAAAWSRGLISGDAVLSEHEIDELIFLPGFSTAKAVSELSGRGVGMDVVKSGVQALGGRISVASYPGKGTTFVLSLPLTLAVMEGMLISVCGRSLIVPLSTLLETIHPKLDAIRSLGAHARLLSIRGEHVPLIDLGHALGYLTEPAQVKGVILLVEDDAGRRAALLVDDVLGQQQVVIKSIQANYRMVEGIAAATILGDGRVALILDVNSILLSHGRWSAPVEQRLAAG